MHRSRPRWTRLHALFAGLFVLTGLVILKLFYLQVIQARHFREIQASDQQGYTTLPARRGEIFALDPHTGEPYKLATNITLKTIYADPLLIVQEGDPEYIAEQLAPLLFDLEEARELDQIRMAQETEAAMEIEDEVTREELLSKIQAKSDEELYDNYLEDLTKTLSQAVREYLLLNVEALSEDQMEDVETLDLEGIEVTGSGDLYAFPEQIEDREDTAEALAEVLGWDAGSLAEILEGDNRYVVLKYKLSPEVSEQIEDILQADSELPAGEQHFLGIRLLDEYYRYYPEGDFLSQVLGWVDNEGNGQYGLEQSFNEDLKGQDGIFTSSIDVNGNQITVGNTIIESAVDGADVYLTIDRVIQMEAENYLAWGVEAFSADSGELIVIDAKTGAILAMAQYPGFDPNAYGEVYELVPFEMTPEEKEAHFVSAGTEEDPTYWYITQEIPEVKIQLFQDEENPNQYFAYANEVGPSVYLNNSVQSFYEPGSIFKPLTMVFAIDAGEVTPQTLVNDSGPVQLDDYYVENFNEEHLGTINMTTVLVKSNNVGMVFVGQQLGPALFYDYLDKFGFGQRTGIEFAGESKGLLEYYTEWSESELGTKAFGQGIAVTPIQLAQAFTALANDGLMMQPYIVQKLVYSDGSEEIMEPQVKGQVISSESAQTITAMMVATCESYAAENLVFPDHYVACKSGTAQTYINGQAVDVAGATIGSLVGYAPVEDPQFIVIVKLDHPKASKWGVTTAGAVFNKMMQFLLEYYNIEPDRT